MLSSGVVTNIPQISEQDRMVGSVGTCEFFESSVRTLFLITPKFCVAFPSSLILIPHSPHYTSYSPQRQKPSLGMNRIPGSEIVRGTGKRMIRMLGSGVT